MSKFEVVRAALLAVVAGGFLAFDVRVAHGLPGAHANIVGSVNDVFRTLAVLHGELTLLVCTVALWPGRVWLRMVLGGFAMSLVTVAIARLASDYFMFESPLLTLLCVAGLMVASFSLPCATWFLVYRRISAKRLVMFRTVAIDQAPARFGIRHLMLLTTCVALVALSMRPLVPDNLAGQFSLDFDRQATMTMILLCLFPGFVAGPLALAVMRPSWRILLMAPWILLVGIAEMVVVDWVDPTSVAVQDIEQVQQVAFSIATGHVELGIAVVVSFALLRIGGVKLA